ncbi:hypothetical protein [Fervidobacterium thailandense]|uniref:Uncharacterized protein n=1 Tax=Fervidobacterium thailandense TaxID=1008305 RepID=A0A1E3G1G0_9BACT|nr:hypothetical protein [Fervidobacterium thailandense]ODN30087.1 hypothetical protein A4H02_07225 [Fervidobacterium thailandense]
MEKLNLYRGKVKVLKIRTLITLLFISLLPSLAILIFSAQWKVFLVDQLIRKYPLVFNNISDFKPEKIEEQVKTLKLSVERRLNEMREIVRNLQVYVGEVRNSSYFLRVFSYFCSRIQNKIFLTSCYYDGSRVSMDFYEYGYETQVETPLWVETMKKVFPKKVELKLLEERKFLGDMKYFRYFLEAEK